MLEKTEKPKVYRDTKTGALINKDINKLNAYRKQKRMLSKSQEAMEEINQVKRDLSEISERMKTFDDDIGDIKKMLKHLIKN